MSLEQVDIWVQDEARIGQQNGVTRIWARKGTRPRVIRQQQFDYVYLLGAVCPALDRGAAIVSPVINHHAMLEHLKEIARHIPPKRHAVMVLDRAAWHTTEKIKQFKNISFLFLPPASPELNPQEQVWRQLRHHSLSNYAFQDYDCLVDKTCQAWNHFIATPGNIKKLCSRSWFNLYD